MFRFYRKGARSARARSKANLYESSEKSSASHGPWPGHLPPSAAADADRGGGGVETDTATLDGGSSKGATLPRTHARTYVVPIPNGIRAGETFDVWTEHRVVQVRLIGLPENRANDDRKPASARFTVKGPCESPGVTDCGGGRYTVDVPPGLESRGGEGFTVTIQGRNLLVFPSAPSRRLTVIVPPPPEPPSGMPRAVRESPGRKSEHDESQQQETEAESVMNQGSCCQKARSVLAGERRQLYEFQAPQSVGPGDPILLAVQGMECLVTLPWATQDGHRYNNWNEKGRKVRFHLPHYFFKMTPGHSHTVGPDESPMGGRTSVARRFIVPDTAPGRGRSSWRRAFRAADLKFQWVCVDSLGNVNRRDGRGSAVPSAVLAERLARKASVRKWLGGGADETGLLTDGKVPPVRPADECRYALLLCSELCAAGRAETEDGFLSGLAGLPPDVRSHVLEFCSFGCGTDGGSGVPPKPPALVRRVTWADIGEDDQPRLHRDGSVDLVPAGDVLFDSRCSLNDDGRDGISISREDIFIASVLPYERRVTWLRDRAGQGEGQTAGFEVHRDNVLGDSVDAIMAMNQNDLRKTWRVRFVSEGGGASQDIVEKDWFHSISSCLFDPDLGLWTQRKRDGRLILRSSRWQIQPSSENPCPDDHFVYFRFLGRLLGRSLLDGRGIPFLLEKHMYKLLLGWPITMADLQDGTDPEYYQNLMQLTKMTPGDVELLCLDFSTYSPDLPNRLVELVPGGESIDVTDDNLPEFLEACLKHRLFGRVEPQARELVLGFLDVVPDPLLSVFTVEEIEMLLFDAPEISVADLKRHATYSGKFVGQGLGHEVCAWFWEIVSEYQSQRKEELVRFITGEAPSRPMTRGNILKLKIHGVRREQCAFPRADTSFDRISIPLYPSKDELKEKLAVALDAQREMAIDLPTPTTQ